MSDGAHAPGGGDGGLHARRMDGVYRRQRHVYDLTRKYYLFGRDRLIADLDVPDGGRVLELGCGTGRNLALIARRYRRARLVGLDISRAMLATAERRLAGRNVRLVAADAATFQAARDCGTDGFERIVISYALSMIPSWRETIANALDQLAPGGRLMIVDFGQQERLPAWFRGLLRGWLARFHVTPRADLVAVAAEEAATRGLALEHTALLRGYAWQVTIGRPGPAAR